MHNLPVQHAAALFLCAGGAALIMASTNPLAASQRPTGAQSGAVDQTHAGAHHVTASDDPGELKLAGCLMRHQDVPGPRATVADPTAKHDGYMLVGASASGGHHDARAGAGISSHDHASTTASDPPSVNAEPPAPIGDSQMFKLEGISEQQLASLVGKRIEVVGKFEGQSNAAPPGSTADRDGKFFGDDRDHDAALFTATAISEVPGPCYIPPVNR